MGWTTFDSALQRIRETIGRDPAAARGEIRELLETAGSSGRVRLWGLEVLACNRLGDFEDGLRAYEWGRKLRGSALAHAELEGQVSSLYLSWGDLGSAHAAADRAEALIRPLAMAPRGDSNKAQRKARHVREILAAVLVTRAQIAAAPGCQEQLHPFDDLNESLRLIDPRYAPRVHLAAVSTLAALLTQNAATPEHLQTALRLESEAQKSLRRRKVCARHPHRAQLRGIRALALAKLGAVARAEEIMTQRVIPDLRAAGLESTANEAAEQLLWIVSERAGQDGRARYLRRLHGLPPKTPQIKTPEDDPDDPIGF